MSKMRGGGKHKDKKSKSEKMKQAVSPKRLEQVQTQQESKKAEEPKSDKGPAIPECDMAAVFGMIEENEECRKIIERVSEAGDIDGERRIRGNLTAAHEFSGWDRGKVEMMECGIRWAVEAR